MLRFYLTCKALVILLLMIDQACAQVGADPSESPGGGGQNPGAVIITVSPSDEVPMGTKVTLKTIPNCNWTAMCEGHNPIRILSIQPTNQIVECPPRPGQQMYHVTAPAGAVGDKTVKFRAPDGCSTIIEPTNRVNPPTNGGPPVRIEQIMKTTLTWSAQKLGPCAEVCYKEKVTVRTKYKKLSSLNFELNWQPNTCVKEVYGIPAEPALSTMIWISPTLYDRCFDPWSFEEFKFIQSLEVDTVVATQQHFYMFYGKNCDLFNWGPLNKEVWLDLVLKQATDANNQPIPIPGIVPTRYWNFPV